MKIGDALSEDCIRINLSASTREDAIEQLVTELAKTNTFADVKTVYHAVLERERIMTTGVGNGIAIPHCKHESCEVFKIALGVLENPIDFASIDGNPVRLVFLLIGPNNTAGSHIKLLSRISRLINRDDVKDRLFEFDNASDLYNFLIEEEKAI